MNFTAFSSRFTNTWRSRSGSARSAGVAGWVASATFTPFFAAAGFSLLNVTFGYFALPESLPPQSRRPFDWSRAHPLGTLRQMRKYPAVITLASVAFLWQIGHQVLPSVWAFYTMEKFGWSTRAVGASLAASGIVMAISQGMLTRVLIPKLGGERRAAVVGLLAGASIYLLNRTQL